ncbi:uncharacterized protein LOC126976726 [Leptidea sinapis]|uniref:uncharacterized protein LOC126976726 n=1 Tax=Leptidea sinapis TaxID=189913 RepID=UPI0021C2CAF5|nr:uncharacterized protein LOC126976726 [Leptidea sinapis]
MWSQQHRRQTFNCYRRDLTAVKLQADDRLGLSDVVVASVYLPGEEEVPTPELTALVSYCETERLELIISADSNAHHTIWGSQNTNKRGEDLLTYLFSTNLNILNRGSEPTYVTARAQTIIDLTLATDHVSSLVNDWHVSDEPSCSDHRWIRFNLRLNTKPALPRRNPRKTDRTKYDRLVRNELMAISLPDDYNGTAGIETHVTNITQTLINSYEQTCPLTSTKPNSIDKSVWWGPELDRLRCKVRKLFNRAKNTRAPDDWDAYKQAQYRFKRRIRERKRESWRRFCTNIESTNQAAKVKNILSRDPERNLGCLKKSDGTYTKSDPETCELLLQTHFPGCRITNNQTCR